MHVGTPTAYVNHRAEPTTMLDVFFTVDVEIWCDGWTDIDAKFPEAFRRYIRGPAPHRECALQYMTEVLRDHGLHGVYFVEPLFSLRFGKDPLAEIVGIIQGTGQEVQLHLHPEWVDESRVALFPAPGPKRPNLHQYTLGEQTHLVRVGRDLLMQAGAAEPRAFRAGNFQFNRDTLAALEHHGIPFDSSYNGSLCARARDVFSGTMVLDVTACGPQLHEYPIAVFDDGTGTLRHVQIGACSFTEIESLLWQAAGQKRQSFVILCHNFELMNPARTRQDTIVMNRFRKLCRFLDRHRDSFRTCGFRELQAPRAAAAPPMLRSPIWKTGARMLEQFYRRRYR